MVNTKKTFLKLWVPGGILLIFLFSKTFCFAYQGAEELISAKIQLRNDYTITVNEKKINSDVPTIEFQGIIYLPIRFATEALGAKVFWQPDFKKVKISFLDREINLTVGSVSAEVNKKNFYMVAPSFIYEGRTMIPFRWTAEQLGAKVKENKNNMKITIPKKAPGVINPEKGNSLKRPNPLLKTKKLPYPSSVGWLNWPGNIFVQIKKLFTEELTTNTATEIIGILVIISYIFSLIIFFWPKKKILKEETEEDSPVIEEDGKNEN